jgi:ADP-dependent phosphofructokinase/glucokinase
MTHQAVLGLGGTVDFELQWDAARLEVLAAELGIAYSDLVPPVEIDSERALVISLLCHLRAGTGGEHYVTSPEVVERFAERFEYRVTLGGTPVRAALAMSTLGLPSTVHLVSIDDNVRRLLPANVDYLCSADEDSTDPHLIVQYPAQARIHLVGGEIITAAANRLIYPSDQPNRVLRLSQDLPTALSSADIFLISGLNSIQEREVLDERLAEIVNALAALPDTATVLYEDAGFHIPAFNLVARTALAEHVDICSMNEDELMAYAGGTVDLLNAEDVRAAVVEVHAQLRVPILVLHTRHFAIAHGRDAQSFRGALSEGVAVAGARYRYGDGVSKADIQHLAAAAAAERSRCGATVVAQLEHNAPEFVGVAAFDLRNVPSPTTVGLGDAFIGGAIAALLEKDLGRGA